MSDANRTSLEYGREVSFNLSQPPVNADASAGTNLLTSLRFTKAGLKDRKDTVKSDEIKSNRQLADLIRVGVGATGTMETEMTLKNFDDLICAAMMGDEFAAVSVSCNISTIGQRITPAAGTPFGPLLMAKFVKVTGAGNSGNNGYKMLLPGSTSAILKFPTGAIVNNETAVTLTFYTNFVSGIDSHTVTADAGANAPFQTLNLDSGTIGDNLAGARYVKIAGFTDPVNNGIMKAELDQDTGEIVLTKDGVTFTNQSGANITIQYCYVRTGTTLQSHLIQQGFLDNGTYMLFPGQCVDTMELKMEARQKVMLNLGFVGYEGIPRTYATNAAAAAQALLTSTNVNVSNNDTVTIGNKTYTFKTALTPTEGEVLIGGSADLSLLNLIRAINHTGTPNTDYKCAAAHTQVSAGAAVSVHTITITALTAGADGNDLATTEAAVTLTWGDATMIGGHDALQTPFATIPVNTTTNIGDVTDGGAAFTNPVKTIDLKIANNLRERPTIGAAGTLVFGTGDSDVSGNLNAYFTNNALLTKYKNHTPIELEYPIEDEDGNVFNIHLPRILSTEGAPDVGGKNSDVMQSMPFQATTDPTLDYQLQIDMLTA